MNLPHNHGDKLNNFSKIDDKKVVEISDAMKQLGDPSRLQIFWLLCHREECVINIAAFMDMSSPAVSHHLRVLKIANLIESRREGKEMFYRAKDNELTHALLNATIELSKI